MFKRETSDGRYVSPVTAARWVRRFETINGTKTREKGCGPLGTRSVFTVRAGSTIMGTMVCRSEGGTVHKKQSLLMSKCCP